MIISMLLHVPKVKNNVELQDLKKEDEIMEEFIEKDELNKFEIQGLIQCFEYTFELAWKTMKDYLENEGFEVKSPRQTIQTAF